MPATTVHPAIGGSDFRGKTRSFTVLPGGRHWATCKACGSTLYPQRFESSRVRTVCGSRLTVETYRCRCGKGHQVRRPLEAAAA